MNPVPWLTRLALLVLATFGPATAAATEQAIHKCRDAQGVARYQDAPCPAAQRTEWVREADSAPPPAASPSPASPPPRPRATAPRATTARRTRHGNGVRGAVISLHRDAAACERAKKAREQAYARLGLRRDFATSRRMDDRVHTACR